LRIEVEVLIPETWKLSGIVPPAKPNMNKLLEDTTALPEFGIYTNTC